MPTDLGRLLLTLSETNPWWETGGVPSEKAPPYRRRDFYVLQGKLERRPILALSGPRQVGKTTVMHQLIQALLKAGVPKERVFYITFDSPGMSLISQDPLNDSIRVFEERILRQSLREIDGPVYIFIDEITKVSTWHSDLKGWFDLGYNVVFVVTSSSLAELQSGAAESLTGRITMHLLLSWKFVDVLCFRIGERSPSEHYLDARDDLRRAISTADPRPLARKLAELQPKNRRRKIELSTTLQWYLIADGFPELIQFKDPLLCAKRLDEYIKLTLAHDLYRFHKIRSSTRVFEELLSLVANQSGGLCSYRNLAETLGIEERTVVEYLDYLEGSFLVSRAYYYTHNRISRLKKQRKIYVPNPGFLNVLRGRFLKSLLNDATELGFVVESVVHGYAKRLAFNLTLQPDPPVFYWRDRRDREVDMIIEVNRVPIPIEVKYRENPKADLGGLNEFVAEKSPPISIVVTKNLLEVDGSRLYVPLEDFLMLA